MRKFPVQTLPKSHLGLGTQLCYEASSDHGMKARVKAHMNNTSLVRQEKSQVINLQVFIILIKMVYVPTCKIFHLRISGFKLAIWQFTIFEVFWQFTNEFFHFF